MKAAIHTKTTRMFECPDCGTLTYSYEHFNGVPTTFGPWYCESCGCSVRGELLADGTIDLERHIDRKADTLVLLRLDVPGTEDKPVHIVVKGMVFYPDGGEPDVRSKNDVYFYNEHTCPWNYLGLPIKEGDNTDPHGLFVHQETILMPAGYVNSFADIEGEDDSFTDISVWAKYFPSLRKPKGVSVES